MEVLCSSLHKAWQASVTADPKSLTWDAYLHSLVLRIAALQIYYMLSSMWVYKLVGSRRPGWGRFLISLPVMVANLFVTPLVLHKQLEAIYITPLGGSFSLSSFKIAAFCFDRGPLTIVTNWWQFVGVMHLPTIPMKVFKLSGGTRYHEVKSARQLFNSYASQCGVGCIVAAVMTLGFWPILFKHWLYALSTALFLGGCWDLCGAAAKTIFKIDVAPGFDKPWLSTSFADYWARRWNLTTTYMLRVVVYEPVMEGQLLPRPSHPTHDAGSNKKSDDRPDAGAAPPSGPATATAPSPPSTSKALHMLRRFVALEATFLFSGVWHILIFWYNTDIIEWRWMMFFIVQAPVCFVEGFIKKAARRRNLTLPPMAAMVLSQFLLILIARPLFFGPVDESNWAERNVASVSGPLQDAAGALQQLWASHGPHVAHKISSLGRELGVANVTRALIRELKPEL